MTRILLAAALLAACSGAPPPEACLAPQLAGIETRYFAEAIELCDGHTWQTCPARPQLEEKYDALRRAAVESCQ